MLRRRSTQACPLEGIVVRLGELSEHPVEPGHSKTSDSAVWPDVVEDFVEDFGKKFLRRTQGGGREATAPLCSSESPNLMPK